MVDTSSVLHSVESTVLSPRPSLSPSVGNRSLYSGTNLRAADAVASELGVEAAVRFTVSH